MAGRILNRRELRAQADQAEGLEAVAADSASVAGKTKGKVKAGAAPKVRKPRAKKAPLRVCARWGLFDNSMKQVATFDYNQRAAAEEKLADLLVKKKGIHFLQIVKESMPDPVLAEALVVA